MNGRPFGLIKLIWLFKRLKDCKERILSGEENHYQRVVVSLKETIRLMKEIDKSITKWPME